MYSEWRRKNNVTILPFEEDFSLASEGDGPQELYQQQEEAALVAEISRLTFGNVKEAQQATKEKIDEELNFKAVLNYNDLAAGGPDEVTSQPVDFSVDFNPNKEKNYTMDLQGTIFLENHGKLVLK